MFSIFVPKCIYRRGSNGFITEKTTLFQGSRGGSNIFQWRGGGGVGVQILISIEPHITCDPPGGGGGYGHPYPPMDPHINTEAVILIETGV